MGVTTLDLFSSPIGLGHVTRDIAIAENLEKCNSKNNHDGCEGDSISAGTSSGMEGVRSTGGSAPIQTRFVTGGGAAQMLRNLDFDVRDLYRNYPRFVVKDGSLQNPRRWLWQYYLYYRRCKAVSRDILVSDRPDLLVSDEDFASLSVAQELDIPTILITDIRRTRFTGGVASLVERYMNRAMHKIMQRCERVILLDDDDNENGDLGNVCRAGPIVRQVASSRDELRKQFGLDRRTITVSIGGTDAGLFLIKRTLEAISGIGGDLDVVVVSGPSAEGMHGDGLYHDGMGNRIRSMGLVDNLHELVMASDVLVSLAGRSTMDEAAAYGTPAVFIPIRRHFEQEDNARRQGFVHGDVGRLRELIQERLRYKRQEPTVPADGTRVACEIIREVAGRHVQSNA